MLGDVARVVGEVVGDEVVGDGVQLDGVDVTGVVVERGQHLVPTGGADDHLPLRRRAERRERQRPDVGVEPEVAEGCVAAVPAVDRGADQAVVVQHPDIGRRLVDVDAEDGAPLRVDGLRGEVAPLAVVEADVGKHRGHHDCDRQHRGEDARVRDDPGAAADREPEPATGQEQRGEEDRGDGTDLPEEQHDDRAGETGADQVGEVQAADAVGMAPEQRGDDHADRDVRDEQPEADREQQREVLDRVEALVVPDRERVDRYRRDHEVTDTDGDRADDEAPHHQRRGGDAAEAGRDRDEHAAEADAEERQPDDEVRVVVVELERDDARVADLEQDPGQAHQEQLEVVAAPVGVHLDRGRHAGRGGHRGTGARSRFSCVRAGQCRHPFF